ncbi:MAG: hypothetical protein KKA62_04510 [Nanoarchaeota archaeon]|nr:hypothetical protein [Nanoarchaeota archaeon]MBU1643587.1 hypothetical protein [Nanoarchaeota archaeon]MBU1977183.1 hypothetical protein [Nanoarchaeota archaeon]
MTPKINKPEIITIIKTVVKKPKKVYVASVDGKVVHEKNCPFAKKIGKNKKIHFNSKTKAFNERYKACSCILEAKKKRRRVGKKTAKKKPEVKKLKVRTVVKTVVKTIVKRPKKHYVAAKEGDTLHVESCPFAKKIAPESRIFFESETKAFHQGYKACSCIKNIEYQKRRKKRIVKVAQKVPIKTRTIIKTIIKRPKARTVVKMIVKRPKKHYVAAKEGDTLHLASCPFAKNINPKSRVVFKSETKAFHKGYKACSCIKKTKGK